jgi:hypothetical protein
MGMERQPDTNEALERAKALERARIGLNRFVTILARRGLRAPISQLREVPEEISMNYIDPRRMLLIPLGMIVFWSLILAAIGLRIPAFLLSLVLIVLSKFAIPLTFPVTLGIIRVTTGIVPRYSYPFASFVSFVVGPLGVWTALLIVSALTNSDVLHGLSTLVQTSATLEAISKIALYFCVINLTVCAIVLLGIKVAQSPTGAQLQGFLGKQLIYTPVPLVFIILGNALHNSNVELGAMFVVLGIEHVVSGAYLLIPILLTLMISLVNLVRIRINY